MLTAVGQSLFVRDRVQWRVLAAGLCGVLGEPRPTYGLCGVLGEPRPTPDVKKTPFRSLLFDGDDDATHDDVLAENEDKKGGDGGDDQGSKNNALATPHLQLVEPGH